MTTLSTKLARFNPAPIHTQADSFELARARAEREFTVLSDRDSIRLAGVLQNVESSPRLQELAYDALHRAVAPLSLLAARDSADRFQNFDAAYNAAEIATWTLLKRWDARKGMKLSAFLRHMLPVELEKQRKEVEVIDPSNWAELSIKATISAITLTGHNRLFLTGYSDSEGIAVSSKRVAGQRPRLSLTFRAHATVTYMETIKGNLITARTPMTTTALKDVEVVKGGKKTVVRKEVELPQSNPMLTWLTDRKTNTLKFQFRTTRNWPRKTAKAITGYKLAFIQEAGSQFRASVFGNKFTSRLMQRKVFHKPFRPIREENVTPRMIQDMMRKDRETKSQPFDERAWSITKIGYLMEQLHQVTSYDAVITDDEGDSIRYSDFLAAPEQECDDREIETIQVGDEEMDIIKPSFDEQELDDARYITERLQESGLWDIAMNLPLQKFLAAHHAGRPGFCTLCSRYGVRVKHALQIVKCIDASLR